MLTGVAAIASSSADWTFAGARLISSASTRLAKIGPSSVSKRSADDRQTWVPTMSAGIRSGVNCNRENVPPKVSASVRTASVLATPGTPSSSTWPRASSPTIIRSTIGSWPTTTRLTSNKVRSRTAVDTARTVWSAVTARRPVSFREWSGSAELSGAGWSRRCLGWPSRHHAGRPSRRDLGHRGLGSRDPHRLPASAPRTRSTSIA